MIGEMIGNGESENDTGKMMYWKHGIFGKMKVSVSVENKTYYGLIDTGAQVSLISANVVQEIEKYGSLLGRKSVKVRIKRLEKEREK